MGLQDVFEGRQSWADYVGSFEQDEGLADWLQQRANEAISNDFNQQSRQVEIKLNAKDYDLALDSGLGALGEVMDRGVAESEFSLKLSLDKLIGGIGQLNADFNLLMGDLVWKFELCQESLNSILQEIRLAEFEREARAYRTRAERAYMNGWYEEALRDFIEAAERNYPDYAVHRSIASIYLYHFKDLPNALDYFRKAAKYSRPSDRRQSAEAHYFAGMICWIQQRPEESRAHLREASDLDPELFEAHYQMACLTARMGEFEIAIRSLESAIHGDARYYERARNEPAFDIMRSEVEALLARLMQPLREKVEEVREDAEALKEYVVAEFEEEDPVSNFSWLERQVASGITYQTGLGVLETLSQVQERLQGIHDRFYKKYEIDPRDYVRSVAFSNDGRLLASGFLNGGIQVWEVDSGLRVYAIAGHLASVNSVAFSPDNLWMASASRDRKIKLWETLTGAEIQTLNGHKSEVRSVSFCPHGRWLVSGGHDRTIRVWRVATGREVQTLQGHTRQVTSTVFSPGGELLASGSWDRTIKIWDVTSFQTISTLTGHAGGVASLAFSPDGKWLASGGEDAVVKLWEVGNRREVQSLKGHHNSITSVAFSPDGRLLAAGSLGQNIIVWKVGTWDVVKHLKYRNISYNSVAFSPQGQWLALGNRDLQLWLKAILTKDEYAEVKAGELRARQARRLAEEERSPTYISQLKRSS